MHFVLTQVM